AMRRVCRLAIQCHMLFSESWIRHKLWGGPPGPRGSPWTRFPLEESGTFSWAEAGPGAGRGPGGPPHNLRKACRISLAFWVAASSASFGQSPRFESEVVPILRASCWSCHGGEKPQAGLDLRSLDAILRGGRSGPAIQPGASDKSLLVDKVVSKA